MTTTQYIITRNSFIEILSDTLTNLDVKITPDQYRKIIEENKRFFKKEGILFNS